MSVDMGIPGAEIGLDETKRYAEAWGGGYDELPEGMSVYDYEGMVDRQIKEAQYERLTRSDAIAHSYALAQDQNARPAENPAYLRYDRDPTTSVRPESRRVRA
jgi:hypothetical protein